MMRVANAVSLVMRAGSDVMLRDLESLARGLHNDLRTRGLSVDRSQSDLLQVFGETKG